MSGGTWSEAHDTAARSLVDAAETLTPCAPLRELLPTGTVDDGYAIAQRVVELNGRGRRLVGRKIGLTSAAVQEQMGVDTPDFGMLFADMAYGDSEPVPTGRLLQPKVEGEIAFVLGTDLPDHPVVSSEVIRAVDFVVAAIEIVDSRIRDWDISIFDTVADNASSGLFVLGGSPRLLTEVDDLRTVAMELSCDGDVLSAGTGAGCLGHPLNAVVWLANAVVQRGSPLRAGEVILSGSLGPLVPVQTGRIYEATFSGLGSVRARFVD